jgi:opacity protein-like surface antigen
MSKRTVSALACCAAILALFAPAQAPAQGISSNSFFNWNFLGSGARAHGMGGAFLGVSNDGNAGTWNPAGLIYNEGVLLNTIITYTPVDFGLDNTPLGPENLPTNVSSINNHLASLSSATFVAPLTIREHEFYLSPYYHRVLDSEARGEFSVDDVDSSGQTIRLGTPFLADFNHNGNVSYIGAGFGTSITPNLSVGANLNIVTGDGRLTHTMLLDSTRYSSSNQIGASVDSIRWDDWSNIDYSGLNFTLAAMYSTDRWSAGAVFTPGWTLTQNLDYRGERIEYVRSIDTDYPHLVIVPGPDGTDWEIQIPYTVGLGGSYQVNENLLVAADYQFRAFKREGDIRYESDPVVPNSPLENQDDSFYNLHQVRLGAEYLFETNWGLIPLRLGVRNDPLLIGDQSNVVVQFDQRAGYQGEDDPARQTDLTPRDYYFLPLTQTGASGDQINPITFTIGSGIRWSQVHLDFAIEIMGYTYEESGQIKMIRRCDDCNTNDPKLFRDEWGQRAKDEFGSYKRTYDDSRVRFSFNFTGYF